MSKTASSLHDSNARTRLAVCVAVDVLQVVGAQAGVAARAGAPAHHVQRRAQGRVEHAAARLVVALPDAHRRHLRRQRAAGVLRARRHHGGCLEGGALRV
jgi:hypothetical protein